MKNTIKLFVFAAMITMISSCAKNPAKLLIKKDGTWTATTITTVSGFPAYTDVSDYTFTEGSGTTKDQVSGDTDTFTWAYDSKTEQMTLTMVDGTNTTIMILSVTEIEKDSEKWTFVSGTLNGVTFTTADFTQVTTLVRK